MDSGHELIFTAPHLAEFRSLLEVVSKESDRGAVLVYASMLDELLRRSIQVRLVQHKDTPKLTDGFNAPLGSFGARTLAALALGVISDDEYEELQLIRKIRNDFAHSMTMSFKEPSVIGRCKLLKLAIRNGEDDMENARRSFITSASALSLRFVNRAHYVAQERLKYKPWRY